MKNKIQRSFDSIHAEEQIIENTKAHLDRYRERRSQPLLSQRAMAYVLTLAILILGFGGWQVYSSPVSAISVDVNPSFELAINRFDRVVGVTDYSEDTNLLSSVQLTHLPYLEALQTLLSSESMQPYLRKQDPISITVLGRTEEKREEMRKNIDSRVQFSSGEILYHDATKEDMDLSHEAGMSFGRYRAFKELQEISPEVTLEEVKGWTMKDFRERTEEIKGSPQKGPHKEDHGSEQKGKRQRGQ